MVKAIIFDCFGVLAEDGWTPFKRKYIDGRDDVAMAVKLLGKEVDSGRRSYEDMIYETARLTGVPESVVRSAVGRQVPNEELFAYIESDLKLAYKIGILSNASYNVLDMLFTDKQAKMFDASVLSYDVGLVKPDSKIYELIAERLGALPEECIMVDDQPRHCNGAVHAGMQTVLYENVTQCKAAIQAILLEQ